MPPGLRLSEFQAVKLPSIAPGPRCEAAGAGPRACSPTDGAVGASAGAVLGAVPAEPGGSAGAMPGSVPAEGFWYSNGTSGGVQLDGTCTPLARAYARVNRSDTVGSAVWNHRFPKDRLQPIPSRYLLLVPLEIRY